MTESQAKVKLDELESLTRPLVEYLRKKYHPHTAICLLIGIFIVGHGLLRFIEILV